MKTPAERAWGRWLLFWLLEALVLLLDIIGVGELYEILHGWIKWKSRPLSPVERQMAEPYFGKSLDWQRIRIDDRAKLGTQKGKVCYVTFHIINCHGAMEPSLFMHEMVHIWQYTKVGSVYILRALWAQHTPAGYNYGGASALQGHQDLWAFNYEQMADIIADGFRLKQGQAPQWGFATRPNHSIYEPFLRQLAGNNMV
ncbi:MAG TPA: hypothetical protein PKA00_18755 [Saprospiraceae bacterium]|nr:hypothetical protein [Saprospiraceae bacterium]HMQ84961.1 hypothetical protein [Saprospiraceae bacterium]